jgi:hypothetical protein
MSLNPAWGLEPASHQDKTGVLANFKNSLCKTVCKNQDVSQSSALIFLGWFTSVTPAIPEISTAVAQQLGLGSLF